MSAGLGSPLLQQNVMPNYANHIMFSTGMTREQPGGLHSLLSYHFNNNDVIIRQHRDSANSSPQSLYSSPTQSPRSVCSGSSCSAGSSGVPSPPPLIQMRSPVSVNCVSSRSPRSTPEATVASLKQQEQQHMSVSSDSKLYNILVNKRTDYEYEQRLAWDSAQRSKSRGSTPTSWEPDSVHSARDHYSQRSRSSSFSVVPQTYTDSSSQDGYRSPSSNSMSYRSPSHESPVYQNSYRDSASYSSPHHISESYSSPRQDVYITAGSPCPRTCCTPEDYSNHSSQQEHSVNLKRTREPSCDQPMDLSCKRTKTDDRPASRSTPSHCSMWDEAPSPCPITSQQSHQQPAQSILQSILSGQRKDCSSIPAISQWDSPSARCGTPDSYSHTVPSPFSNPQSPQSPDWDNRRDTGTPNSICSSSSSHHPSTLSSLFGQSSSPSSNSSTSKDSAVCLAKKNLFPVTARVSDWIVKLVKFAQSLPEFQNLTHNDKVTLVLHAWARLLLLFMAETNFQFAVTPKKKKVPTATLR